ncbi:MAG: peptidylprolyl isomerase [Saprospiraceae bacterium]|nr:MAG: peptidylprolyl isomerase [Saprospiraceae bacterium]
MKSRLLTASFLLTCWIATSHAQKVVLDKVIAQVGTEYILLSELEEQYALMRDQQGKLPPNIRCFILDNLLTTKLLINQAKLDSVQVSDEEVEAQLNARIDQILEYMGGDVRQFEEYYGQTINEVKEAFREDLRNKLLAEKMNNKIMADITVTPSEVKAFFNAIPRDSLPYFNAEVEVGELVYKPRVSEAERQKALEKCQNLRRRIVDEGEDFAELAKTFSDDFASARIGGDLGWTKRGKFVPEFEAAAYNLEEGEVSECVETEFGFHIIQLLGRRGNSIHTRHILVKPEITDADIEQARHVMDSIRQMLIEGQITFSEAVKRFGYKEVQSYHNDGKMINPATGNTYFEIADLDPDIYFTIDTMKVGQFSNPFTYTTPRGEVLFRIVQLQSRTPPHRASLATDYSKIQAATIEQKKMQVLNEWLRQKLRDTYVHIDDYFMRQCPELSYWVQQEGMRP